MSDWQDEWETEIDVPSLIIREAKPSDADAVRELLVEAANWMVQKGIDQWRPESFTREEVSSYFDSRRIFLGFAGDEPAAMFTLQESDPSYWGEMNDPDYYYLHRLNVRTKYRRMGLSEQMMKWAIQKTLEDGKKGIRLDCVSTNLNLNLLYQSLGFRYMATRYNGDRQFNLYEWFTTGQEEDDLDFVYFGKWDYDAIQQWAGSPEFLLGWAGPHWQYPLQDEQLDEYLSGANFPWKSDRLIYTVIHRASGQRIGHISLEDLNRETGEGWIGKVIIGSAAFRGKGLGERMVREMLRIAFDILKLNKISLRVFAWNQRAIRSFHSAGLQEQDDQRMTVQFGDKEEELLLMSIDRNSWNLYQ
ncbi:hypothetical protein DCC85_11785 [Paenibacillus sp. CAA11]|uniref:GNAT family N-acetyltransferase n=1 Tax=Paenibacillus sp. CAA11 TaxID=1532905 RepID=UPI000D35014A|nr:GNAT family N-acetyltransferase [Paenibacillus sp. CAA11]AWB44831.1 hypothetical protein DCC85_11785 [Paenibacillus sp. CAA11]